MICIIALVVFAVLAVFSAKYRPLAAEAFDCVFRRVTFRKCHSGLDKRLKAQLTGNLMRKHKRAGRFVYKYFEVFSWFFLILLVLSLVQIGISTYNVVVYGNCNGLDDEGFCIFDPLGSTDPKLSDSGVCAVPGVGGDNQSHLRPLIAPVISSLQGNPRVGSASAPVTVVEFGCFACPNTAEQQPAVKRLIEFFGADIQFIYVDFPLPSHEFATESAIAARCVQEQDARLYWQYHFIIFDQQESLSVENLRAWALFLGVDADAFDACLVSDAARAYVDDSVELAVASGVFGTPTFFIDDAPLVGVQSYKFLKAKVQAAFE